MGNFLRTACSCVLSGTFYDSAGPDGLFYKEFNTPVQNNERRHGPTMTRLGLLRLVELSRFDVGGAFSSREKGNPTAQSRLRRSMIPAADD